MPPALFGEDEPFFGDVFGEGGGESSFFAEEPQVKEPTDFSKSITATLSEPVFLVASFLPILIKKFKVVGVWG
jgi:hypothetical protein